MLEGWPFTIYTDHKPLTHALQRASEPWTARQCRHLSYVAEFTSDVCHISGVDNVVADTMSRPPPHTANCAVAGAAADDCMLAVVEVTTSWLNYAAIAARQASCPDVAALARHSSLHVQTANVGGVQLLCDMSTGTARPLIPTADKKHVFTAFHTLAHPGTRGPLAAS
jgi:hypothetical protein